MTTLTLEELKRLITDKNTYPDGDPVRIWCEKEGFTRELISIKRAEFKNEDSRDIVFIIK